MKNLREAQFAVVRARNRQHMAQLDVSRYTSLAMKASVEEAAADEALEAAEQELAEARRGEMV